MLGDSGEPQRCTAQPPPQACHAAGRALASRRWQTSRGSPALEQLCVWEVSASETPSRQAPSPGWASRGGRRQMSGEAGEGQAPHAHRLPSGLQQGAGRAPETRLGLGQPLTRAGSQAGGWGLGQQSCP